MGTLISLAVFLGGNFAIWWGLNRWGNIDRARADQRTLGYLRLWNEDELLARHADYIDQLSKNQSRSHCLRELEAIKAALEIRRKISQNL